MLKFNQSPGAAVIKCCIACKDWLTWVLSTLVTFLWIKTNSFYFFPGNSSLPGRTQAFSSYPGSIFSGDDFYILSSGLVRVLWTLPWKAWKRSHLNLAFRSDSMVLFSSRLHWKPPLETAILLSGSMSLQRTPCLNGWGTSWPIDWPLMAYSGLTSSAGTTVGREFHRRQQK